MGNKGCRILGINPAQVPYSTGQWLCANADGIYYIIRDILQMSDWQLQTYTSQSWGPLTGDCILGGSCGVTDFSSQTVPLSSSIERMGTLAPNLRVLRLGVHEAWQLGPSLSGEIDMVRAPDLYGPWSRWAIIQALLPDWASVATLAITRLGTGVEWQAKLDGVPAAVTAVPLRKSYEGLYWPDNFFRRAINAALATLYQFGSIMDDGWAVNPFTNCNVTAWAQLRDRLLTHSAIQYTDDDVSPGAGCDATSADWRIQVNIDGTFEMVESGAAGSGFAGSTAFNSGSRIVMCGTIAKYAANADYLFWWAEQLFLRAIQPSCRSPWLMMMACLAARAALAEICLIAGIICHEYVHYFDSPGDHCVNGCCHVKIEYALYHKLLAKFGCPPARFSELQQFYTRDFNEILAASRPFVVDDSESDRFRREHWAGAYQGGFPGCTWLSASESLTGAPSGYRMAGEHCQLFQENRDFLISYEIRACPGAAELRNTVFLNPANTVSCW